MTPEEKKSLGRLKSELYNYPEMMMVSVTRKDLELIVKYMERENKKATDRKQA